MIPVVSHEVRTHRWPYVTICLMGLNVLVFVFELSVGPRFVPFLQEWGIVPARINAEVTLHNQFTVATSMFLHVGVIHLIGNLWFLFVFGDAVENALGHWWYLALYLVSGFFGSMTWVATAGGAVVPAVGASGAISGVMAASLVLWPTARLRAPGVLLIPFVFLFVASLLALAGAPLLLAAFVAMCAALAAGALVLNAAGGVVSALFAGVSLPAWLVLGLYAVMQLFNGVLVIVSPADAGSVGYWAHIGGFVAGGVLTWLFPAHPRRLLRGEETA